MELHLLNTQLGLMPIYPSDYDERKKLTIGEVYKASIKVPRNLAFHRKYFALINCAWEYLTTEQFRKYLEVSAGHFDQWHSPEYDMQIRIPKSIAFDKMDGAEFSDLYRRVKDVLFSKLLTSISEAEFNRNLINF